jgi:NAD(P)H-dependent FMN reductase
MTSHRPLRLAAIVASTREGRFAPIVARWFAAQISERPDFELEVIDLAELELPVRHPAGPHVAVDDLRARLAAADVAVVITPEYNHSFPGWLKHALDLSGPSFQGKPVGFVSYGGLSGGLRAVEALRVVFAELHAATVRDTVSFHGAWERFDADGEIVEGDAAAGAAKVMLDQLQWWGRALAEARRSRPYGS